MVEPRRTGGRRIPVPALPCVEADVVVIAASRYESGSRTVTLRYREAENPDIESERAFEIRHLEMDMTDADAGIDRRRGGSDRVRVRRAREIDESSRQVGTDLKPAFRTTKLATSFEKVEALI